MHTAQQTATSPTCKALIRQIDAIFIQDDEPMQIAQRAACTLQPFLGHPDLLLPEQKRPDPDHYCQHLLYADEYNRFSIIALVWLPNQRTPIHDHISWCAFGVHQGEECEHRYALIDGAHTGYLCPIGTTRNRTGSVAALTPPGDIHYVLNTGPDCAISIHIYGANIAQAHTSIRRRYDLPIMRMPVPETPTLDTQHASLTTEIDIAK